jgi:methionyl-tRNA formyltransferase
MPDAPFHVIFCGTSSFAVPCLQALVSDPAFAVDLVITQPDKPVGRDKVLTSPPVALEAKKHGLKIFQPENINKELPLHFQLSLPAEALAKEGTFNFQFLVVVSYGQILSKEILALPSIAAVNVHASLLPRWRGASPIQHAILESDTETGVTVQIMEEKLDAGPILSQKTLALDPRETYRSLHDKLAPLGAALLSETLKKPLAPKGQPSEGITMCRKLTRENGKLSPENKTAEEIDRAVRALTPWPGVTVTLKSGELKILESDLTAQPESAPLPCKDGTVLHLVSVQPAGKKPMSGAAWARGAR